jgi:hypothetical protein
LRSIGLNPSPHDPCFYTGFLQDPRDPSALASASFVPLFLGLHVDGFFYFSEDPVVETLFKCLLMEQVKVDLMGLMEWFWGIHFSWCFSKSDLVIHMN